MVYTVEQKINIIKWYCRAESAEEVVGRFIFSYPDEPVPTARTVLNIFHKFEECGCVNRCTKCCNQEPRPIPEARSEKEVNVCAFVEVSEPCSSSQISEELDIPNRTVRRILKKNGYKAYKMQNTQEIFPDDHIRRMEFCESIREKIDRNNEFARHILFTDESSFSLLGRHNPSVVRYWSRENKHFSVPLRTQYPQKVNVWAGILGDNIVGPFFIDGTLNAERYLHLLQNSVVPAVRNLDVNFEEIWLQQDGCPAHNARPVQDYLSQTFPERLISTRGIIPWPPRSPDLTPCDFFLWGHLTQILYKHRHERAANLDELRLKIRNILRSITPEILSNVRKEFYDRLGYCEAQEGGLFEHLIK